MHISHPLTQQIKFSSRSSTPLLNLEGHIRASQPQEAVPVQFRMRGSGHPQQHPHRTHGAGGVLSSNPSTLGNVQINRRIECMQCGVVDRDNSKRVQTNANRRAVREPTIFLGLVVESSQSRCLRIHQGLNRFSSPCDYTYLFVQHIPFSTWQAGVRHILN